MLRGKKPCVTGASRGIGRDIALTLAEAGADVAVNYAGSEAKAEEVVDKIKAMGRRAFAVQTNVASYKEVEAMVKRVTETFGRLDILVNNAGITRDNLLMRMKESEWDEVIETNLKGVFNGIKAVSRPMMTAVRPHHQSRVCRRCRRERRASQLHRCQGGSDRADEKRRRKNLPAAALPSMPSPPGLSRQI